MVLKVQILMEIAEIINFINNLPNVFEALFPLARVAGVMDFFFVYPLQSSFIRIGFPPALNSPSSLFLKSWFFAAGGPFSTFFSSSSDEGSLGGVWPFFSSLLNFTGFLCKSSVLHLLIGSGLTGFDGPCLRHDLGRALSGMA